MFITAEKADLKWEKEFAISYLDKMCSHQYHSQRCFIKEQMLCYKASFMS